MPTLPATTPGSPAARQTWPSHSATVVLPLVPVSATKRLSSMRQPSSSSPITGIPRSRAAAIAGAPDGTPGLFTTALTRSRRPVPSSSSLTSTPSSASLPAPAGDPESAPYTRAPRARRASAAAMPERASPTTSHGPSGRGGRGICERMAISSPEGPGLPPVSTGRCCSGRACSRCRRRRRRRSRSGA